MKAFTQFKSRVCPLDRPNVDTDAIIPKQYLKSIKRTGFGPYLFDDWRYLDKGDLEIDVASRRENPDFEINQPDYRDCGILLARENFGCGSSREHAVWALENYGFRVVIAPSYADIFHSNCFKNGVLPIRLSDEQVDALFNEVEAGYELNIDLATQTITRPNGEVIEFEVDPFRKDCMLQGLDDIGLTLKQADDIRAFEQKRSATAPWLFNGV